MSVLAAGGRGQLVFPMKPHLTQSKLGGDDSPAFSVRLCLTGVTPGVGEGLKHDKSKVHCER